MAYDSNNLSALSYANGFTLWHYKTDDERAKVCAPGYFNPAATMLRVGDLMIINATINIVDMSPENFLTFVVLNNVNGEVALSESTADARAS